MITKYVSKLVGSNAYLVKNDNNEALMIDAGCSYETIKNDIKNVKVLGVLITHCHFDHIYFLKELLEKLNCPAYVSKNAQKEFYNENFNMGEMFGAKIELPTKNIVFVNEGMLTLGGFNINVLLTPGHSTDCACFLINSTLFSGDTLFYDAIGRTDFAFSSVAQMLNSLKKLQKVKFGVCLSGHGVQSDYNKQQENIEYFIELLENNFI